ncbi:MAG: tRNA pseudouridine(38-40) synthase TruA [Chloroflexi bacterium]|nr:tRNA pseudouridine(38-40) synthase TruA [Chloroflexota bacterium]
MIAQNYYAVVEYDGTEYAGFQIQVDRPTIQGELERALRRLTQEAVRVHGAGRTDAGVHAKGQVISFRAAWKHEPVDLQRAMNAVLPQDIAVRDLALAEEGFHARFSASSRMYIYRVWNRPVRSPLWARFAHHVPDALDVSAMVSAARYLLGEQDFRAFGQPPVGDSTVRMVHRVGWRAANEHGLLCFEIEANAFLRGMVRRIVGSLLQVGIGRWTVNEFADLLASRDIARCAAQAPACGLCLWRVRYENLRQTDDRDLRFTRPMEA